MKIHFSFQFIISWGGNQISTKTFLTNISRSSVPYNGNASFDYEQKNNGVSLQELLIDALKEV